MPMSPRLAFRTYGGVTGKAGGRLSIFNLRITIHGARSPWLMLLHHSAGRDGGTSLKVTVTPRSELSCVVRTRSNSFRAQIPRLPLGSR
jgi:hypothetical protein